MNKRFFTLLELLVGIALIVLVSGVIGWRMHTASDRRGFRADLERLRSGAHTLHRLAVNMEADWRGILKKEKTHWSFEAVCLDQPQSRAFSPLSFRNFLLYLDGKEKDLLVIDFFSSGEIRPSGSFLFRFGQETEEWKWPEFFRKEQGDGTKQLGPIHPDEV